MDIDEERGNHTGYNDRKGGDWRDEDESNIPFGGQPTFNLAAMVVLSAARPGQSMLFSPRAVP